MEGLRAPQVCLDDRARWRACYIAPSAFPGNECSERVAKLSFEAIPE
jgi:hypothetical protein